MQPRVCVAVNDVSLTSCGVEVWYPVKDDTVQEQGRGVDLHGSTQKTVQDPNVADRKTQSIGQNQASHTHISAALVRRMSQALTHAYD